jgi:O-antigen ligase
MRLTQETALAIALLTAVLAFGGTEPFAFAAAQILLFVAGMVWLAERARSPQPPGKELVIPLLFLTVPLAQWLPGWPPTLDRYETQTHIFLLAACLCAFVVTRRVVREATSARRLLLLLLALGGFEALFGLGQVFTGSPRIFYYVNEFARGSATGTYINRNHFASLMAMLLPLGLAACALAEQGLRGATITHRTWREQLTHPRAPALVLALFVAAIMVAALLVSRSRMGVTAGAAAVISALLLLSPPRFTKHRGRGWLLPLAVAAGTALALWDGGEALFDRFAILPDELDAMGAGRWSFWRGSVALIAAAPLTGWGLGTFALAFPPFQQSHFHLSVSHAHNDYLQAAVEIGMPAAMFLFGAMITIAMRGARATRSNEVPANQRAVAAAGTAGIVAMLVHGLADFNLYVPGNAIVFSVLLGLTAEVSATAHPELLP